MKGQFSCVSGDSACIAGYWDCGSCTKEMHRQIWKQMPESKRNYDRMVDPMGAYTSGYSAGADPECTCHINPPCGYCTSKTEDES